MSWGIRDIPASLQRSYLSAGFWNDETLGDAVAAALLAGGSDLQVIILDSGQRRRLTFQAVLEASRRFAQGIAERGVQPGDVVAFRGHNTLEAVITFYGLALLGTVIVPLVPSFANGELSRVLLETGARALVDLVEETPDRIDESQGVGSAVVELTVSVSCLPGTEPWSSLMDAVPLREPARPEPAFPALIACTSGSAGPGPKCVIHSHRTVMAEVRQLAALQPDEPGQIIGAPVGHAIGMLGALLVPLELGRSIYLSNGWNPRNVLEAMLALSVGAGTGSPYFLNSLLDHPRFTPAHLELIRYVGLGGAPVLVDTVEQCREKGISLVRMYGATEHPSITGSSHEEPEELRTSTDGHVLPGVEIRLIDDNGVDVPASDEGEILSRGPDRCIGYTDTALAEVSFDSDGWFHTGDIGRRIAGNWIVIAERKTDIISRAGRKLSSVRFEIAIVGLPGVTEVAVLGLMDEKGEERAAAFVRMDPAVQCDLVTFNRHLRSSGLPKEYILQEVHIVKSLPRMPSGKVSKEELRSIGEQSGRH